MLNHPHSNYYCEPLFSSLVWGLLTQWLFIIITLASEAPRHVSSFCSVIVWQAPSRAYGVITEYQVSFSRQDVSDSVIVNKRGNELFHLVNEMDLPSGQGDILIMVCGVTGSASSQANLATHFFIGAC